MTSRGLILAAPTSGSGKTTVTLGILRALARRGVAVRSAKSGPDYIDPAFHAAASGAPCLNLDAWAMGRDRLAALMTGDGLLIIEGAMGLFDGAPPDGKGATADLARTFDLPVVLVVDAASMAQSVAPLVMGFAGHDPKVRIAGVILNRVGSARHLAMLRSALAPTGLPLLGALMRDAGLALPSRHLGLVQAGEHGDLETFLGHAADCVESGIDLAALQTLAGPISGHVNAALKQVPRQIAVARDAAFAFLYPHQVKLWQDGGATITYFSPLNDDPVPEADLVYLPGGYPELHGERLAGNRSFMTSLRAAAGHSVIYGECGGYMVLGESLIDGSGTTHKMAGLLGLQTSFARRKLHLGYRTLQSHSARLPGRFKAHEFHYATTVRAEGPPLFEAWDAEGMALGSMGLIEGGVSGSFAHIIDLE